MVHCEKNMNNCFDYRLCIPILSIISDFFFFLASNHGIRKCYNYDDKVDLIYLMDITEIT